MLFEILWVQTGWKYTPMISIKLSQCNHLKCLEYYNMIYIRFLLLTLPSIRLKILLQLSQSKILIF